MTIKAVIFDLDGTLNLDEKMLEKGRSVLRQFMLQYYPEESVDQAIRKMFEAGQHPYKTMEDLGSSPTAYHELWDQLEVMIEKDDSLAAAIEMLREYDLVIHVVTCASPNLYAQRITEQLEIFHLISGFWSPMSNGEDYCKGITYEHIAGLYDCSTKELLVVGDSIGDVLPALERKAYAALVGQEERFYQQQHNKDYNHTNLYRIESVASGIVPLVKSIKENVQPES